MRLLFSGLLLVAHALTFADSRSFEYKFEEESGQLALDSTGNQNHGVIRGDASRVEGHTGQGLQLAGGPTKPHVQIPDNVFAGTTEYALAEAWIKPTQTGPGDIGCTNTILRMRAPFNDFLLSRRFDGGIICGIYTSEGPGWPAHYRSGGNVPLNEWSKVSCQLKQGVISLSVNGEEVSTLNSPGYIELDRGKQTSEVGNSTIDGSGITPQCPEYGFIGVLDDVRLSFTEPPPDEDEDGVADEVDQCAGTPAEQLVDGAGCSISQYCPCDGFKNHGQLVSCRDRASADFVQQSLITSEQSDSIVEAAAKSSCGKPKKGKK